LMWLKEIYPQIMRKQRKIPLGKKRGAGDWGKFKKSQTKLSEGLKWNLGQKVFGFRGFFTGVMF